MTELTRPVEPLAPEQESAADEVAARAAALIMDFCDNWQGEDGPFVAGLVAMCKQMMAAQPGSVPLLNLCNDVLGSTEREATIFVDGRLQRATVPQAASNAALKFAVFLLHHTRRIANEVLPFVHSGSLLLTHSYSTTVLRALLRAREAGKRFGVVCTEARPGREGARMAEALARSGIEVELIVDAAAAVFLHGFYTLLIGANAIGREAVVNKVGTYGMALAARSLGVPVYCLAGSEKYLPCGARLAIREHDAYEIVATQTRLHGFNLYLDETPLDLVTRFFTEDGTYSASEMRVRLRANALHPALRPSA